LAAQLVSKGHFILKFSVFAKFIEHLPTAADFGVSCKNKMNQDQTENYMREAIAEGRKALGRCAPNPPVGCVLVRNGKIISKGHTNEPGQPHAEAMALAQVEGMLNGVVAFVTLEPCSFHGRTPSCAKELMKRGIQKNPADSLKRHVCVPREQRGCS